MKKAKKKQNIKRELQLDFIREAEERALKNREMVQNYLRDFMNSYAMQRIRETFNKIGKIQKAMPKIDYKFLEPDKTKMWNAPPPLEIRIKHIIEKAFKENLDKYLKDDKFKSEIRKKIAHCRFCGTPVMHVEDLSCFIRATIKCTNPKCKKIVRIPQDLTFKDIDNKIN